MTFDQIVQALESGAWLHYGTCLGASQGRALIRPWREAWRRNGRLVTFKRDPSRNYIPIKHGLRVSRITARDSDLKYWHVETECPLLQIGAQESDGNGQIPEKEAPREEQEPVQPDSTGSQN